jgi:P4 family phage/plasmid primase-like protien
MTTTYEAARRYTEEGLHVIPIWGDGSKTPALETWAEFQTRPARPNELEQWFEGREDRGIAIIGGNGLEVLDVDEAGLIQEFDSLVEEQAPGLLARLPRVATPRPGFHLYYLCDTAGPSQKLAMGENDKALMETRGEGGYVLAPPSPACCHLNNKPYVQVAGPDLTNIPRISPAERDILLTVARSFTQNAKRVIDGPPRRNGDGLRPGDIFNATASWPEILEPAGWTMAKQVGQVCYWRRPGKEGKGWSATTGHCGDRLYCFTSSGEPFDPATAYTKFAAHTLLNHAGDYAAASRALTGHTAAPWPESPRRPEPAKDPHRLARTFVKDHPWVFWNNKHFEYAGTRYVEVLDSEVAALLTRHAKDSLDADFQERLLHCEDAPRPPAIGKTLVANVLQALKSISLRRANEVGLPSLLPDGKRANLLGLTNGLLDLDAYQLRPHTPDWFSLVCLPYAYDPAAACPRWVNVLAQNLEGDAERLGLIQQFFGYTLVNSTDAHRALFLVGEGANGKSVVLAGLHAMLGDDNVSSVPLEDFGHRFAMAQTLGKLANICPEVGELDRTAEGTLKAFVSGDKMSFERKGKDGFSVRPTARLVFSTNNVPRFMDKTDGVWRRLLLVPFNRKVPVGERVAGMDKPDYWLRAGEVPGILNWALEGLRQLRAQDMKFTEPAACRAALQEQRADADSCRAFLEERYTADPQGKPVPSASLYAEYRDWCEKNGFKAVNVANFGHQVRRVFDLEESKTHRFSTGPAKAWFGLAPRQPEV